MIYEAQCTCGHTQDYFASVADMDKKIPKHCGKKMQRVMLTPPQVGALSWQNHKAVMVAGKYIDSGSAYKRLMKEGRYMPEHEARVEAKKARAYAKERHSKKLDQAIEKAMKGPTTVIR